MKFSFEDTCFFRPTIYNASFLVYSWFLTEVLCKFMRVEGPWLEVLALLNVEYCEGNPKLFYS